MGDQIFNKNLLSNQKIDKDLEDLITRIGWLYYVENLTQHEIAERLFLSRPKVQRLLERAKDLEIVRFQIRHPHANVLAIEKQVIERFDIKDAMVVPAVESTNQFLYRALSKACSLYLERLLPSRKETVLGFGWGNTIALVGSFIELQPILNPIVVVSLNGHLMSDVAMNPFNSAVFVAQKMQVPFYNIWAPAIAQTKERAEVFKSEPWIREVLRIAANADVLIVSIGEMSKNASLFKMGFIQLEDTVRLEEKNAVGDILGRFLDCEGNIIEDEIHDRVIGIPIEILRSKDRLVIGVAGGEGKYQAIRGAILGGFIDVLITDEDTAIGILEIEEK